VVDKLGVPVPLQLGHDLNDYKKHDTRVLLFPVQLLKHLKGTSGT